MNRIGLLIALGIALVVGATFAVDPHLDIVISGKFLISPWRAGRFPLPSWVDTLRDAASLLIALLAAPGFLAVIGKLIFPNRRMLIGGRAALFLIITIALGPGLLANGILKQYSGRMRPVDVVELGGAYPLTPWWDLTGPCPENCSFIAGEPSGAFWTLAPAALAPPQYRPLAYAAALTFGAVITYLRIAGGGHFFTDAAFGGVFIFLVIWTAHGLIFRWHRTTLTDVGIEHVIGAIGLALRRPFAGRTKRRQP